MAAYREDVQPLTPAEADWVAAQRRWMHGWRRHILTAIPLVYLVYLGIAIHQYSRGAGVTWGFVILGAFAAVWLVLPLWQSATWRTWVLGGVLAALLAAELPFAHAAAFVMAVFLTILAVTALGWRSLPIVTALTLAALLVPVAIPSWHTSLQNSFEAVNPVAIPVVALVVFVVASVLRGNDALAQARAELARLAAENERIRIARDLHDLLGHSLTTITVKAGLAARLSEADFAQARAEMAEVEALARRSIADVRAAVSNYREVTLMGELARGRELLRAAGISAEIPKAVDVVDPANQELFGWAVREGITNIVRHAHASSCAVHLSASSVEIVDDGVGAGGDADAGGGAGEAGGLQPGNGLAGLRERVAGAGGVVDAGPLEPRGWRLRVSLAAAGAS